MHVLSQMAAGLVLAGCVLVNAYAQEPSERNAPAGGETATATFAGGCFWCMEPPYDKLEGVLSTTAGYIGGSVPDPSYEQVSSGTTGHAEAVQVTYDREQIGYQDLLDVFWRNIDPLDGGGQFCDRGSQYRSAIFYHNERQQRLAEASKQHIDEEAGLPGPVVTGIVEAGTFYEAEEYHQNYYEKNPIRYRFYRWNCGRGARLEELWGDE